MKGSVAAIVLAAGESRRMGSPKALLALGETTFLGRLLATLRASRARPIVVVLGHAAPAIRAGVDLSGIRVVENPSYREGMLSSIRAGLDSLDEGVSGALLFPVDHPRVSAGLVDSLIARFEETGSLILLPVSSGRRGHPVLFARRLFDELRAAPDDVGARRVVWDHAEDVLSVETHEEAVTEDVDTPDRYRKLVQT